MPLDQLTATRLARDGEQPGAIRHMCSGQHSVSILLSKLKGWDPTDYWREDHPSQVEYRGAVARAFGTTPERLRTAIDGCGVLDLRLPAARGRPRLRPARRPVGRGREGLAVLARTRP